MKRFFSSDSILSRFLTAFANILLINILFIITSIPLFTIGPALTAMYSTIFKWMKEKEASIFKNYFDAFKQNFKQSVSIWIPFLIFIISLSAALRWTHTVLDESQRFIQYPISIAIFLLLCIINYIFPQVALFKQTSTIIIRNSILLALANFPTTLLMIIIPVIIYLIAGLTPEMTILVLSLLLFIGFGLIAYFYSVFLRRIFNKLLDEEEQI